MFTGGQVNSGQWAGFLGELAETLHNSLPPEASGEYDSKRAEDYKKVINIALNKLLKQRKVGNPTGANLDDIMENKKAPSRPFGLPGGIMYGVRNDMEENDYPKQILEAIKAIGGFDRGQEMMDRYGEIRDLTEQRYSFIMKGKLNLR